jgi:hypothetical protein
LYTILRESEEIKSSKLQSLKNLNGKKLKKTKTLNYEKDLQKRKSEYLKSFTENISFIKAELDFTVTIFHDE